MKKTIKIITYTIATLAFLSVIIFVSGNQHLFKAVASTYLLGKTAPSIDEHKLFENRTIETGDYQPWLISENYNKTKNDSLLTKIIKYDPVALLVIKNDSICYEEYWDEFNENSLTNSFSVAKTFTALLIGAAIDEGLIESVDDPVSKYLPQYKDNPELTIKHLLTMSSGIDFDESYKSPFGHMAKAYYGSDIKKLNENYTVTETPGETWKYLGGNTIILSFILEEVTGMSLSDYMSRKIWQPIGAKNEALWSLDHKNGREKSYCCFYSNARDFARIGKLVKDNGMWNDQSIISTDFMTAATTSAYYLKTVDNKPVDFYGYEIWLTYYKDMDIYYARGINGQYIISIPEKDLVIVRLGKQRGAILNNHHLKDLYSYIDFALEQ